MRPQRQPNGISLAPLTRRLRHPEGYPGPLPTYAAIDRQPGWLDPRDVIRLHALLTLGRLVGDLGTLIEGLVTVTRYTAVVHEEILAALVRADEAVAFVIVEPLYRSLGHILEPTFLSWGSTAIKKPLLSHRGRRFSLTIKPTSIYCILTIPRARSESRKGPRTGLRSLRSRSRSNTTTIITARTIPHLLPRTGSPEAS